MAYGLSYRIIAITSALLWVAIEFFRIDGVFRKINLRLILITFFVIYTSVVGYFSDGLEVIIGSIQLYIIFFYIIVHDSYQRRGFGKVEFVYILTLISMPIWLFLTYKGLLDNARAARMLIRASAESKELAESGVGGFSLIYFAVAYFALLLGLVKYSLINRVKIPFLIVINLIFLLVVIIKAQYSTAVIILFLSIVLTLVISNKISIKSIIPLLVLMIIIAFMYLNLRTVLDIAQENLDGANYQMKIEDIRSSLDGNNVDTVNDRVERYERSFMLFIENPILGTIERAPIGKHSLILDTFAQFGFVWGCALCYILLSIPIQNLKLSGGAFYIPLTIFFITICLMGLNNVAMSYGLVLYLIPSIVINRISKIKVH